MLEVIEPALLTTVQDAGRRGWQAFGVPLSGPMDALAHRAANLLVSNPPEAAAIEIGMTSAAFYAHNDCLVAACGAGFRLWVGKWQLPLWTSVYVRTGGTISLEKAGDGNWLMLAIHGGIQTPPALGSRATTLRATLTGQPARPLQANDILPIGPGRVFLPGLAARKLASAPIGYSLNPAIRVIPGPQWDWFTAESITTFYASTYSISPTSDRAGFRLNGPPLERTRKGELISEGMARGCIQVPADGQPIVMQADCPTTGGYPKIASVIAADQPLLAQTPLGSGQIRFVETSVEEAQSGYRALIANLETQIANCRAEDDYLWSGF
ncbi:MAG TPA: KipI antagonist [Anaerolineae bacterium]|jgi:antagonist of KipI|nr:KipI antagonist [Anaerolineae bacterium]